MRQMLLAAAGSIAAIALSASAAQAQSFHDSRHGRSDGGFVSPGFGGCNIVTTHRGGHRGGHGDGRGDRRGHRGADSRFCATDVVMSWYGGEWARWNNRSWEPFSYNDWWHENPSRAYPAWISRNHDCARQWYSGDTLRC